MSPQQSSCSAAQTLDCQDSDPHPTSILPASGQMPAPFIAPISIDVARLSWLLSGHNAASAGQVSASTRWDTCIVAFLHAMYGRSFLFCCSTASLYASQALRNEHRKHPTNAHTVLGHNATALHQAWILQQAVMTNLHNCGAVNAIHKGTLQFVHHTV